MKSAKPQRIVATAPQEVQNPAPRKRPRQSDSSTATTAATATSTSSASALVISASDKAGMDNVDRARIDEIILRESGNSKFMQQQRRRDAKVDQRIHAYQTRIQQAKPSEWATTPILEQRLLQWQSSMPSRATSVVVDMDMFYMACELLDKPHLKDVPACVGRGMILTSNYQARKFGVRSAMPGWIGDKLVQELSGGCQQLVHVPSNFELYKQKSKQVMQALNEFDPNLRSYSLDEAYLDLGPYLAIYLQRQQERQHDAHNRHVDYWGTEISTGCHSWIQQRLKEPSASKRDYHLILQTVSHHTCRQALENIVQFMRRFVEERTGGLTCSAGIAPTVALAKIASDRNKPNGQCFVDPAEVLEFIRPLPVRKVPGIGRVTDKILNSCQIATIQDLWEKRGLVNWLFPSATGEFLLQASIGCMGEQGLHDDENEENHFQKGISRERTFGAIDCWTTLLQQLQKIAELLAADMTRKKIWAKTITLKVKLDSFDVYTKSKRLHRHADLVTVATPLLAQIRDEHLSTGRTTFSCRLLGIRCSNLEEEDAGARTLERFLQKSKQGVETTHEQRSVLDAPTHDLVFQSRDHTRSILPEAQENQSTNNALAPSRSTTTFSTATREIVRVGNEQWNTDSIPKSGGHAAMPSLFLDDTRIMMVQCPLCQRSFPEKENLVLNQHVDSCLSGSTIREVIRQTQDFFDRRRKK